MGTKRITCKFCGEYIKSYDLYVSHIESSHSESIPQDMTAWRFVYYLKTGKTHGSCIICKNDTEWNEKTHKYHRFCNNPKCKEKYVETFQNRMIGKYGKVNLLNDPEQQKKMLANRKISGVYTWRDYVHETPYTGTYELSFLKFLDEIMEFNPEDVIGPSPHTYYYIYEGQKHFYIPDFFIPSLNLEIEIKEGTNNHPKIQAVDKVKERLKDEVMKSNSNSFNYIKIIEKNNFRFIEFLDEAKKRFLNGDKRPIVMCESVEDNLFDDLITENKIINDKDIYYNKDKFDSGEINLCFITGLSGSGKTTMGKTMQSGNIEVYELDDIISNWNFSDANLKEYGSLVYSFFKGPGKMYRYTSYDEWMNDSKWDNPTNPYANSYEAMIIKDFIKYAKLYANSHKNIKFVLEGVWVFYFIDPKELDNCSVYIKGTSVLISFIRSAKRDCQDANSNMEKFGSFIKMVTSIGRIKGYLSNEKRLLRFYEYFASKVINESLINESLEDVSGIIFGKRKLFQDEYITLYHGTDLKDLKRVVPNSYNMGLKNAKPKMSSFWFNNIEYAISFATMTFIETNLNMATLLDNDMKVLVRNEYKTKIISAIRGNKSYVYEKTIESSYVGYGHEGIFPEYTLDIPVKPDHCYIINDVHMMNTIKFVSEDYIKSTIDKYKNGKMIFNSNVLQQKIDKLLYYKNDNNRASKIKKAKAYKSSFDDIVAFNKMLNEYEYIIPNKGNIITRVTLESWNKYYLLTPSEFEKYHGGICWDYVVYETFYFKKYFSGVKFETYFQVVDDGKNYPSHTFLIFEYNNKYYWFESSWKPEAGIYGFNTKNDAINYAMNKLKLDDDYNRYICIYNALDKKMFGMNCDQYMNYMWDKVKPYKYSGIIKNPVISIKNKIQLPITESVEDNLFDELITENIGDKYIRITYNGNGIYQEFKENVSFNVWKEFKNSNATKWLPIPPAYEGNYKSYFTIKGYKMFMKETYPFIIKYLDKNKIKVEEIHFNDSPNVVYKDEFQIVVDGNSDIITESNKSHLYHISNRQNIKTINPSIPNNFMTKNNYEENKTKRVCFAPSIEQCLMGLSRNCEGEEFYVYIPVKHYKTYSPNIKDLPDSGITGEIWIKEPVDVICLGKIKVLDTNKSPGKLYTYGNGKTAELYAFDYKWIERYKQKESQERTKNYIRDEQKVVTESVDDVTNKPIIKTKNTYMIKNDKGTIISKLSYYEYKVKNFDWILMANLGTNPEYRGRGLATKLINELYSDITKNTNKGLYLFVKSDNRTAIRLYTKLNFKKVKNYTLKDGEYIIMAKGNADMSQFDKMNFS